MTDLALRRGDFQMRLIERLRYYEKLLLPISVFLSSGATFEGTLMKIHQDFLTLSSTVYGAVDIKLNSIIAVAPLPKTDDPPSVPVNKTPRRKKRVE